MHPTFRGLSSKANTIIGHLGYFRIILQKSKTAAFHLLRDPREEEHVLPCGHLFLYLSAASPQIVCSGDYIKSICKFAQLRIISCLEEYCNL